MIKINNLTKIYNEKKPNQCIALDKIDLEINQGELVAIVGKSGSGKSTLLHILSSIDKPTSGDYLLEGTNIRELNEEKTAKIRNKKIGIVLQEFLLIDDISVFDNVMVPLYFTQIKAKERKEKAIALIYGVDLGEKLKEDVMNLSGGQKQRVAIARALVNDPDIILADEPTGALDINTSKDILDMLIRINKRGKTVIIVTHEQDIALKCDRIITLADGKILSDVYSRQ